MPLRAQKGQFFSTRPAIFLQLAIAMPAIVQGLTLALGVQNQFVLDFVFSLTCRGCGCGPANAHARGAGACVPHTHPLAAGLVAWGSAMPTMPISHFELSGKVLASRLGMLTKPHAWRPAAPCMGHWHANHSWHKPTCVCNPWHAAPPHEGGHGVHGGPVKIRRPHLCHYGTIPMQGLRFQNDN